MKNAKEWSERARARATYTTLGSYNWNNPANDYIEFRERVYVTICIKLYRLKLVHVGILLGSHRTATTTTLCHSIDSNSKFN